MSDIPFTKSHGKLESLLEKIQVRNPPEIVSGSWLRSAGFKSSNDLSLLHVLKYIGFTDQSKKPTDKWISYRSRSKAKTVLAECIQSSYKLFYDEFDNAHVRSDEELKDLLRTTIKADETQVDLTLKTFKVLCSLAVFDVVEKNTPSYPDGTVDQPDSDIGASTAYRGIPSKASLHIDVQVHIHPDTDDKKIDKIFKSMAKHIYGMDVD